ncbi:Zn-dependent protease with chaperone function [Caldalkalibacillus uzonensis]|uniref:Zn-dependent protease with chaperone function n=1 Tax=Caldalkalibacillus uzonensis TaxID=353224 RepID=A0ABU0CYB0_9BACI|nr:M56 family metallopeptidase [Caldalkalibacillus uzonensis]MDQ0341129.1 Zn-dependent protease with chaperone function [Caldalkalibacillus uzonensis]
MSLGLPSWTDLWLAIGLGIVIGLISEYVGCKSKKAGNRSLLLLSVGGVVCLIYTYPLGSAVLLISFAAYAAIVTMQLTDGRDKYLELKEKVRHLGVEEIAVQRKFSRLAIDVLLTLLVTVGMVLAIIYLPEEQSVLPVINLFILLSIYGKLVERMIIFLTTKVYFVQQEGQLLIVSRNKSKQLPLHELEAVHVESAPDVLKLNHLFVVFTSHEDYTVNLGRVLCLTYPGESIYLTLTETDRWKVRFAQYLPPEQAAAIEERTTLPLWHPALLKRLAGKLYYAVTIKGISAYSALVVLLYQLGVPVWSMMVIILLWWGLNLYFSDRVLAAALDIKEIREGKVYEAAQRIFQQAGLGRVRLYATEAADYNGMAIGMNVGRSMIVLTSATLKLPLKALEGIIAHEAVHVQKRDVLMGQVLRLAGLGLLGGLIALWFDELQTLVVEQTWIVISIVVALIWLFPVYLSLIHQWMEVRADHLGSTYLEGGKAQMAEALRQLAVHQERALDKSLEYSLTSTARENEGSGRLSVLERDKWGWRLLEFQLLLHPPMYWRINTLLTYRQGWGLGLAKRWLVERFKESLPDRLIAGKNSNHKSGAGI